MDKIDEDERIGQDNDKKQFLRTIPFDHQVISSLVI